jgi:hypothetical protein
MPAFAPNVPDSRDEPVLRQVLEAEARADPVVREIMRTYPADLTEVRPLPPQDGDG